MHGNATDLPSNRVSAPGAAGWASRSEGLARTVRNWVNGGVQIPARVRGPVVGLQAPVHLSVFWQNAPAPGPFSGRIGGRGRANYDKGAWTRCRIARPRSPFSFSGGMWPSEAFPPGGLVNGGRRITARVRGPVVELPASVHLPLFRQDGPRPALFSGRLGERGWDNYGKGAWTRCWVAHSRSPFPLSGGMGPNQARPPGGLVDGDVLTMARVRGPVAERHVPVHLSPFPRGSVP